MYFKTTVFHHLKRLHTAITKLHGEAFANVATLHVEIRLGNKVYVLHPMFTAELNGKKIYTHQFTPEVKNFIGWKPYSHRPTPDLGKKLSFKKFVEAHGLLTPRYATDENTLLNDVVVKKNISSFGDQIIGPLKSSDAYQLNAEIGEYFEVFTKGEIVKVWFWNEKPVVMECREMPKIVGDGKSTIKALIDFYLKVVKGEGEVDWRQVEALLRFQESTLDDVLPENTSKLIDFRYISRFIEVEYTSSVSIENPSDSFEPFFRLGCLIQAELNSLGQTNSVYSVDAIRDENGRYWFLEVNFNPAVHPCLYADMLASLPASKNFRELIPSRISKIPSRSMSGVAETIKVGANTT